ncbi:hypothetical protein N9L68_03545 [bacterium]|nr:hypothetical protein [bacterium]
MSTSSHTTTLEGLQYGSGRGYQKRMFRLAGKWDALSGGLKQTGLPRHRSHLRDDAMQNGMGQNVARRVAKRSKALPAPARSRRTSGVRDLSPTAVRWTPRAVRRPLRWETCRETRLGRRGMLGPLLFRWAGGRKDQAEGGAEPEGLRSALRRQEEEHAALAVPSREKGAAAYPSLKGRREDASGEKGRRRTLV